jgi:glycosyltransferase involved in cell wall biosynthesis
MRVGISTSVIQRGKTGIAQYVFALTRALAVQGAGHEFVLFVLEEDVPLFAYLGTSMLIVSVPEKFRPAIKNILWHQTRLPKLARLLELDVLHVPSYRRLLCRRPCALVATIHDLAPFHVINKYDWKRMFYGRVVVRRLARRQDRVIAISQNTAQDIETFFRLPEGRVTVVHNGLEHDRFFPGSQAQARSGVAQKHGLHERYFLYVARLEHPGKNHARLISAFNQFKTTSRSSWQLVLGGSDWHGAEVIHAAIKASPFASDIHVLGFVDNTDLPNLYRAAGAFVYPSLYEGFGLPPIEAMACGCPVISSGCGSLGEVVGNAAAIVDPESVDSIASALAALAGDPALREQFRTLGLTQAQLFNWNKTAAETLAVYQAAAARSSL